jgi:pyruvate kinase
MQKSVMPNRQDLTEITTACLDGADGFILSHETSVGGHFIDATINLAKAIAEAENVFDYEQAFINNRKDLIDMG